MKWNYIIYILLILFGFKYSICVCVLRIQTIWIKIVSKCLAIVWNRCEKKSANKSKTKSSRKHQQSSNRPKKPNQSPLHSLNVKPNDKIPLQTNSVKKKQSSQYFPLKFIRKLLNAPNITIKWNHILKKMKQVQPRISSMLLNAG